MDAFQNKCSEIMIMSATPITTIRTSKTMIVHRHPHQKRLHHIDTVAYRQMIPIFKKAKYLNIPLGEN